MAKKKKRRAKMPALSKLDKAIYFILFLTAIVLIYAILGAALFIARKIAFADVDVIAFREHAGILWILPLLLTLLVLLGVAIDGTYNAKLPIFGRRDITYGPPKWADHYPLFQKGRSQKALRPTEEKRRRIGAALLSVWLGLCVAVTPLAMYGRDCLYRDGSIRIYNMWNVETTRYRADDMQSVTFETYHDNGQWMPAVTVELHNGKSYWFSYGDFRGNASETLACMEQLRSAAPKHVLRYDGTDRLDAVIEDLDIENETDIARLYALFGLQKMPKAEATK